MRRPSFEENPVNYKSFLRIRKLLPPAVVFGHAEVAIPGIKQPIRVPLCRYSPYPEEIEIELRNAIRFWGLYPSDLDAYQLVFTYGVHTCGYTDKGVAVQANGCTWPGVRITVALRPAGPTRWEATLVHELGHVWDLSIGGDGDPDHKLNWMWGRILGVECWKKGCQCDRKDNDQRR